MISRVTSGQGTRKHGEIFFKFRGTGELRRGTIYLSFIIIFGGFFFTLSQLYLSAILTLMVNSVLSQLKQLILPNYLKKIFPHDRVVRTKQAKIPHPRSILNPEGALICHKSKGFIAEIAQWLMARVQKWD